MNKYLFIVPVLAISGLMFAGCTGLNPQTPPAQPSTDNSMTQDTSTTNPATDSAETSSASSSASDNLVGDNVTYTMDDVSVHNTKSDCWTVIDGSVYDLSDFLASGKHPGKDAAVQACGIDGTAMFNSRPNDGTSHSERARTMLPGLAIGKLVQ